MTKKGSTRFKRIYLGTTILKILGESKDRKSWLIQNTDDALYIRISNRPTFGNDDNIEIPPNSTATAKIPEDNPRESVYTRTSSGNAYIKIYEAYAK